MIKINATNLHCTGFDVLNFLFTKKGFNFTGDDGLKFPTVVPMLLALFHRCGGRK